jgi:hypothetical protein
MRGSFVALTGELSGPIVAAIGSRTVLRAAAAGVSGASRKRMQQYQESIRPVHRYICSVAG